MNQEQSAKVVGLDLPISTKHSIVLCDFIRHKSLEQAKNDLSLVLIKKKAVQLTRFNDKRGHRKGKIGPGFFPENATQEILKLLISLEANIRYKGLNYDKTYLKKVVANKASRPIRHGRYGGRVMKRTHIEIVGYEKK